MRHDVIYRRDPSGAAVAGVKLTNANTRVWLYREDFEALVALLGPRAWFLRDNGKGRKYPAVTVPPKNPVTLARLIAGNAARGTVTRHLDGDTLNLRRSNLLTKGGESACGAVPQPSRIDMTVAFDGACLGNPGRGGWGAVLLDGSTGAERAVSGSDPATTNNRMELTAAIEALNAIPPGAFVSMIGDSEYVVKGFPEWLPGWKQRGWRTAKRKAVLNTDLWQALEASVARHAEVRWSWVRGHAGHPLNERAHRLASEQAQKAGRGDASAAVAS